MRSQRPTPSLPTPRSAAPLTVVICPCAASCPIEAPTRRCTTSHSHPTPSRSQPSHHAQAGRAPLCTATCPHTRVRPPRHACGQRPTCSMAPPRSRGWGGGGGGGVFAAGGFDPTTTPGRPPPPAAPGGGGGGGGGGLVRRRRASTQHIPAPPFPHHTTLPPRCRRTRPCTHTPAQRCTCAQQSQQAPPHQHGPPAERHINGPPPGEGRPPADCQSGRRPSARCTCAPLSTAPPQQPNPSPNCMRLDGRGPAHRPPTPRWVPPPPPPPHERG
jgi:hypothetical protein